MSKQNFKSQAKRKRELAKLDKRQAKDQKRASRRVDQADPAVAVAPALGLVLGWSGWGPSLVGLLGGFVIGALVGLGLLASNRVSRGAHIPHGPFMLAGAALALVAGEPVWQGYLNLVGLA